MGVWGWQLSVVIKTKDAPFALAHLPPPKLFWFFFSYKKEQRIKISLYLNLKIPSSLAKGFLNYLNILTF